MWWYIWMLLPTLPFFKGAGTGFFEAQETGEGSRQRKARLWRVPHRKQTGNEKRVRMGSDREASAEVGINRWIQNKQCGTRRQDTKLCEDGTSNIKGREKEETPTALPRTAILKLGWEWEPTGDLIKDREKPAQAPGSRRVPGPLYFYQVLQAKPIPTRTWESLA